ncbi:energy-coupling factor ABC transporter ATP-binding protein [Thalassobacillus sp. CUG 92003]|uniref:energy-coupling factor ABC transporter ATP-binding protein n=1 Tax=Thalassobacillus sp. CUG 92003 TaxID=2736641 RepID=UPI0015E72E19|nr:energy-coupling factor ABC transporter ATP-binding protein [Thalassobacillus sp. CUG 92003]
MAHFVEFRDVSFRYQSDGPWVLKNVNFTFNSNEWLAIIGHNGSGKSTVAKLINGLLLPQEGDILVDGIKVSPETVWDVRERVGMVFQNPDNQFVGTTVRDDVAFGMENHGIPREVMVERLGESLEAVGMEGYETHEPHHLSGGQKQRVAIAGVLAVSPQLIILDEATVMLDPLGRKDIMETIREVQRERNLSLITITHDLREVTEAGRILVMNEGEIYKEGTPRDIFAQLGELHTIGLDAPFITKLAAELKTLGLDFHQEPLTQEELLNALWTLNSNT